jgi:hypothetical protein
MEAYGWCRRRFTTTRGNFEAQAEGDIEKAEIPDWLKEMATVEGMEEEPMAESISEMHFSLVG